MRLADTAGMKKAICISLVASVFFACGGQTDANSAGGGGSAGGGTGGGGAVAGTGGMGAMGGGGSGGAGGGTTGGSGGMAGECSVPASEPGPYAVKIKIVNPTSQTLFVREDCQLNWSLYSCADGYQTALSHSADCTADCNADPSMGCIACGACMLMAHQVTPTQPVFGEFGGYTYTFATNASGCSCYNQMSAQAGKYSIRVPVFMSQQEAESGTPAYEAEIFFTLPAPNGLVEVNLAMVGEG